MCTGTIKNNFTVVEVGLGDGGLTKGLQYASVLLLSEATAIDSSSGQFAPQACASASLYHLQPLHQSAAALKKQVVVDNRIAS